MKTDDIVFVRALDQKGNVIDFKDGFETMKAARAWFHLVKDDKAYWITHFESFHAAELIYNIQLQKNDEIILDHFPSFVS